MVYQKDSQGWLKTFRHAVDGCLWAFRTQKNFKIHFAVSFLVLILAWWLNIEPAKFLILILAIIFGLTIEMANTAFEKTIDLVTEEYHLDAKIAKDVAAGMMLLTAIGLAILGLLILFL